MSSEWSLLTAWGRNRVMALHDVSVAMIQGGFLENNFIRRLQVNIVTWNRMSSPNQLFNQAGFHSLGTTQPRHRYASAQLASSNDFTLHPRRRRRQQQAQARPSWLSGLCGPFRHQLVSLSLGWRPRRRLHPRRLRLLLRRLPVQPRTLHLPRRPGAWSAWSSSLALWSGWLVGESGLGLG
jgi:hypothetical protein